MISRDREDSRQWKLVQTMKVKLKEYNDVLIQQSAVSNVPNPSRYDRELLQQWLREPGLGGSPLLGNDRSVWLDYRDDLIADLL